MKLASPRQRIGAFAIDYLLIIAYIAALVVITFVLRATPLSAWLQNVFLHPTTAELASFATLTGPVVLYFAIMEASPLQATVGKSRLNLRVTTAAGERISLLRSLARSIVKFLPWELAHAALWHIPGWPLTPQPAPLWVSGAFILVWALVLWYIIAMWADRAGRTPYDRFSGTMVAAI